MQPIKLSKAIYLSTFENVLNHFYKQSIKEQHITFDLKNLDWIGLFPASLFFSWVMHLSRRKNVHSIEILLPDRKNMSPQLSKVLLNYNILSVLNDEEKVHLPYYLGNSSEDGIPINIPKYYDNIAHSLDHEAENYIQKFGLSGTPANSVKDIFTIIVFELVENIFIHADGSTPHYTITHSTSSGRKSPTTTGLITVFDKNVDYIEIIIGDLGVGINKKLKQYYVEKKHRIFNLGKNNRKEENILSYAFDFFSTSDEVGRKNRIDRILSNKVSEIKTSDIASGLFCVLQAAKSNQGQFVVRTPQAILGFDFYSNPNNLLLKGRSDLGINSLAPLPGTHYILRIPLTKRYTNLQKAINKPIQNHVDSILGRTGTPEIINPFSDLSNDSKPSSNIVKALKNISDHLDIYRNIDGVTLITPPLFPLIPRALSIFIVGLNYLYKGKRVLVWCNPSALNFFPNNIGNKSSNLIQDFVNGSLYIADIMLNKFVLINALRFNGTESEKLDYLCITEKSLNIAKSYYIKALKNILVAIIRQDKIMQEPGPFLVEGKYYTEKFFEISKALKDSEERRRITEWCFFQFKDIPDIILVTTNSLLYLAKELIGMFKERNKVPEVIVFSDYKISSKVLSYKNKGKKATIITDVICRGKNVQDLLLWAFLLEIDQIITIVDARNNEITQQPFFHISIEKHKKLISVKSILKDPIDIYNRPIKSKKIFVIDQKNLTPTLYLRPSDTQITLFNMLSGPAKEANALFSAHCEYHEKHYAYFLHLPKLSKALQKKIEDWVKDHVKFIEKQSHGDQQGENIIHDDWRVLLCNKEIDWIERSLVDLLPNSKIEYVTKEDLLKPGIPKNFDIERNNLELSNNDVPKSVQRVNRNNVLIIHSAIASGETARLSIEFASRKAPDNIILLCFMARMDPFHRNFFDGIYNYRDSSINFGIFLDFPIGSYPVNSRNCPMCSELDYLNAIKKLLPDFLQNKDSNIQNVIQEKISANKHIVLEYGEGKDNINKMLSKHSMYRAYYRALYEGGKYDIHMRDKLYDELSTNNYSMDRFLEVISIERLNPMFKESEIEGRLTNSQGNNLYPNLKERLYKILEIEKPPFQIGRIVGTLIHIVPEAFATKSLDLMKRYIDSYTDVGEVCIGLILINTMPLEVNDFLSYCRQNNHPKTEKLFSETLDIINKRNQKNIDDSKNTIFSITHLQHRILYSGNFSSGAETLSLISIDPDQSINIERVEEITNRLCKGWRRDISPLISRLNRYNMWADLKQRHTNIANKINELDSYVVKLSKQIETINTKNKENLDKIFMEEIIERGKKIDSLRKSVGNLIELELSFNFDDDFISKFPKKIIANNGSVLKINADIDYNLPCVFCNKENLDDIIVEVIKNWKQHKKDNMDATCSVKVYNNRESICLEFEDNIPGQLSLEGMGGIRMIKEFCSSYGCELINEPHQNSYNAKTLKIIFQTPRFS